MELFFFWLIGSIFVWVIASSKGREGFGYFLLSIVLTPILVGILVIALPSIKSLPVVVTAVDAVVPDAQIRCPDCRELVRTDARKCKHCGTTLVPQIDEKTAA
ncbi:MAG: hypothetical protein Q7U05_03720 [Polaromonas sp.]|nr:hypothetical protein [Polaromonas sp.]